MDIGLIQTKIVTRVLAQVHEEAGFCKAAMQHAVPELAILLVYATASCRTTLLVQGGTLALIALNAQIDSSLLTQTILDSAIFVQALYLSTARAADKAFALRRYD